MSSASAVRMIGWPVVLAVALTGAAVLWAQEPAAPEPAPAPPPEAVTNAPEPVPAPAPAPAPAPPPPPAPPVLPTPLVPPRAPTPAPATEPTAADTTNKTIALKFSGAPLAQVLQFYSELTGRTPLEAPNLNATVTLRSHSDLTVPEAIQAIKTVLAMNNIGLVDVGTKFVKVVPIATAQQEGLALRSNTWERALLPDTEDLSSEIIPLRYIDPADAQKAVQPLLHTYGKMLALERINSLLVADATLNLNRIKEVLNQIDQPLELKEKLHIIQIRHAKASDIKSKLEEIIAEEKERERQPTVRRPRDTGAPGVETTPTIPGVIRARQPAPTRETTPTAAESEEGKMIRGTVKIVADDRTGVLVIITRPENMKFFEDIVAALDVPTAPDVIVKVVRLEYAEAESVASMLNNLIGAAAPRESAPKPPAGAGRPGEAAEAPRAAELQAYLQQQQQAAMLAARETKTKVGQLSAENIKILSDKRTNGLIIMASKGDMATILEIIADMDIMLSQVLIEAVILSVDLGNKFSSGVDWFQRSLIAYERKGRHRDPVFSFAGGGGGGSGQPLDATGINSALTVGSGLTYYFTHFGLNLDAVIKLAASDSRTKVLSSPVILTTDNKEAKIDISTEKYFYKGVRYVGYEGQYQQSAPDVELKRVGLNLTVTPRINQKKFVVMDISQKIEDLGESQQIQGQSWPTINSRTMSASIAVRSGETIILGGLVRSDSYTSNSKIPILGDIPLLGAAFRSASRDKSRNEIIVFITPRVLDTPEEIEEESRRRKEATEAGPGWQQGWSDSKLAEPRRRGLRQWWRDLLK